jgi:hypothetical protein
MPDPVPYDSSTIGSSPFAGQAVAPDSPTRFSDMVGQGFERGADYLGAPMSVVRSAGDIGRSFAGMSGLDLPDDVSDAANYAKQGAYGQAALSAATPFAAMALGPMAKGIAPEIAPAMRNPGSPGFYSHGAYLASQLPQETGTVGQFVGALQKQGLKPAELEHSGLGAIDPSMPATRSGLVNLFQNNMPKIQEKTYGAMSEAGIDARAEQMANEQFGRPLAQLDEDTQNHLAVNANIELSRSSAKYQDHTMPGGENYRELLLHHATPSGVDPAAAEAEARRFSASLGEDWDQIPPALQMRYISSARDALNDSPDAFAGAYRSAHWDVPNVVAHLRMSDRTGADGQKLLHVDELQSDWGQDLRKSGQLPPTPTPEAQDLDAQLRPLGFELNHETGAPVVMHAHTRVPVEVPWALPPALQQQFARLHGVTDGTVIWPDPVDVGHRIDNLSHNPVPPGPFVGSTPGWTDLGLKRALTEAAHGGYDGLTWTGGADQAKIFGFDPNTGQIGTGHVNPQMLSGMKGYYDTILPSRLKGIVKPLDPSAKIGTVSTAFGGTFPHLPITPLMRERILRGLPLYAAGGGV